MKILLLSWNFPPAVGGMEIMIASLFHGLRQRGHEVRVLTRWAPLDESSDSISRASRPGVAAYLLFSFFHGWKVCRKMRPDFILCGSVLTAPAAWLLSVFFRLRWGVPLYGSDLMAGGRLYHFGLRFLLRRAQALFPISRYTQSLAEQLGVDMQRATIIHPGVDVRPFEHEPTEGAEELIALCQGHRVLMTAGRLVRRKGVLEFVRDVMPELVARYPDLLFLVVGDDGAQSLIHNKEVMRKQIEVVIREKGLEQQVRLLGRLSDPDLVRLYFHAHVFVLPGLDLPGDVEGFGIVFSEAALAGVPAVATRAGGVPDAIVDGETGFLVPPGDRPALITALTTLFDDETRRKQMGQAAAERARTTLAWDVIVGQYEQALTDVLS